DRARVFQQHRNLPPAIAKILPSQRSHPPTREIGAADRGVEDHAVSGSSNTVVEVAILDHLQRVIVAAELVPHGSPEHAERDGVDVLAAPVRAAVPVSRSPAAETRADRQRDGARLHGIRAGCDLPYAADHARAVVGETLDRAPDVIRTGLRVPVEPDDDVAA